MYVLQNEGFLSYPAKQSILVILIICLLADAKQRAKETHTIEL
jgi:hypothetical protein